ncbi:MAG: DUF1631 domain-containing protein [Xanthomonadales bacterium]|jgi:hypothetical protein|nr:DUF1631 domain-containing protein [Xanthomonadales bacterium]
MSTGLDFLPFSRLPGVTVPPRVRTLAEGCWQLLWKGFDAGLDRTLRDFDDLLFKHAEKARNNEQQLLLLESMRELKARRTDLFHDAHLRAQSTLLGLADRRLLQAMEPVQQQGPLSLIDNTELEETLAASEVAARAELRNSQLLQPLAIRLAVIGGGEPYSSELLPVGPARVVDWLAHPMHALKLPPKIKVGLLRQFEQSFLHPNYTGLLEALNRYLIDAKVLPYLQHLALMRRSTLALSEPTDTTAPAADVPKATPAAPRSAAPTASPPAGSTAADVDDAPTDAELFATLRELLSGRRGTPASRSAGTGPVASLQDVQGVLSVLQSQPVAPIMVNGRWTSRKAQHIKQDIQAQLRALSAPGQAPPTLSEEDSDTIDLVGMLFDHLGEDLKPGSGSGTLLAKLQVPILKVALNDKAFFARRQHPARQLLNSLAESAQLWLDDGDADPALFGKMQLVVDRVLTEFDQDLRVFENLLGELGQHLSSAQRKAEVAEKRHVEAARGREKLELAREHAVQAIRSRLEGIEVPALLKQLLEGAWCDALALGELRDGEGSQSYLDRLQVADVLIAIWNGANADDATRWYRELQSTLESGLQMVGFHGAEITRTLDGLEALLPVSLAAPLDPESAPQLTPPSEAEAAVRLLESKQRQLESVAHGGLRPAARDTILSGLRKTEKLELNAKEQMMLERIRQIPFGTWFDFVTNQQGDTVRRKLSWYSPVTGRCLFVTARGARSEERTMEQLARDLVRGNARLHEDRQEGVVDRTWKKIVGKLRDWTRGGLALSEPPAIRDFEPRGQP